MHMQIPLLLASISTNYPWYVALPSYCLAHEQRNNAWTCKLNHHLKYLIIINSTPYTKIVCNHIDGSKGCPI